MKRAVTKDPKFTRAWIMLGTLQIGMTDNDGGLASLRRAVESDSQNPLCYKVLAFSLTSIKRRGEAIQIWKDLEKIAPNDHDIATNMTRLLLEEKRYREAAQYAEAAIKLYPDKAFLLLQLGKAYLEIGEEEKAASTFERAVKLETASKNDVAYELALANKRLDQALSYSMEAVQEEEEASRGVQLKQLADQDLGYTIRLAAYWDTLGWVHFRMGNFKQARSYLLAAWNVIQTPTTGYHLAQVYEKLERPADAAHLYRLASSASARGAEDEEAAKNCNLRQRQLKVALTPKRSFSDRDFGGAEEMSRNRTIMLPKLVKQHANAEFFVLLGPGPKVEDTKFISGSEELQSAGKALQVARFTNVAFPEGSSGRLLRRGILACYPITGCSFVLLSPENVRSVN